MAQRTRMENGLLLPHPTCFDSVFHSVTEPMFICDSSLRILEVNRPFADLFQGEPVGRKFREVFSGPGAELLETSFEEILGSKKAQSCDVSLALPDGTQRYFEFTASPILAADQSVSSIIGQVHDISMRKDLERELRVSEERYRKIVETAREGIYIVDTESKIVFTNRRMASMLGYTPEEILGRRTVEFMDESSRALAPERFARRRKGFSETYEVALTKRDGARIHCLLSAAPIKEDEFFCGTLGIVTDITCIKQIEAELQSAKSFSEKIVNSITDNLVVVDPSNYRIIQANQSFIARTKVRSLSELTGRTCYNVLFNKETPCHEDGIFCPVQKTYETGQPLLCETVHPDLRQSDRIIQIATYPILSDEGKVDLVIRTERDITEKTQLEQTLALRSEELLKTQRRLEELFELFREMGTKGTLAELVQFLIGVTVKLLRGSEPALILLGASCDQLLRLEDCEPKAVHKLLQILQRIEKSGLSADFVQQIRKFKIKEPVRGSDSAKALPILKTVAESNPTWSAIPLFVRQQCIGLLFIGSKTFNRYPPADLRFLEALCEQASGHLRNLVIHEAEVKHLRSQATERSSYGDIIGQSRAMQEIYELIDLVACSDATVMITGENGTGKEMVANAIHRKSHRRKGPFVVANCSAYSPTLLESEIFGHEKGSFTGAIHQKKGRIERAHGGTLFLDEIGEIAPAVQIFLLRFLQDHRFERVGGEKVIAADVRVLAATNRDLQSEVQGGRFRDDLFYRLNVIAIHLPSLKERTEDIPLLAQYFLNRYNIKEHKSIRNISPGAMQALMNHDWPGNVRQLENAISHAVVLSQGDTIRRHHLPKFLWDVAGGKTSTSLSENERVLILNALKRSNWNKHDAARRLNISRSTLYSKMRRFGLDEACARGVKDD